MKYKANGLDNCIKLSESCKHLIKFTSNKLIYVVGYTDGIVKIGVTKDFKSRISALKNGRTPNKFYVALTSDGFDVESLSQKNIKEHNTNGEYFECDFEVAKSSVEIFVKEPVILSDEEIERLSYEQSEKKNKLFNLTIGNNYLTSNELDEAYDLWVSENKKINIDSEDECYVYTKTIANDGLTCSISCIDRCLEGALNDLIKLSDKANNEHTKDMIIEKYFETLKCYEIESKFFPKIYQASQFDN